MTRLTDLSPDQAKRLAELECPDFATRPWVTGPELSQRRIAIVSSAGLVVRGEDPFRGRDPIIARSRRRRRPTICCAATSRSISTAPGCRSWNVIFPIDRMGELAAEGTIGSVADTHYSFMGATDPADGAYARELAGRLKQDASTPSFLPPVDRCARAP